MPLHDSDFKSLAKLHPTGRKRDAVDVILEITINTSPGLSVFAKAGNRMGTARRCNLARLFFTLRKHQRDWELSVATHLEVAQTLIRVSESIITSLIYLNLPTKSTDLATRSRFVEHFRIAIINADIFIEKSSRDPLILPDDSIQELKHAGLLQ